MNQPIDLFEYQRLEALRLRDIGIAKVARNNPEWLEQARALAVDISRRDGKVAIDQITNALGMPPNGVNACGAVFHGKYRGGRWAFVERRQNVARTVSHARKVDVWRYEP